MNKSIWLVILLAYTALMVFGAILPNPSSIPGFGGNTKYFHVAGFVILAMLLLHTFHVYNFKQLFILTIICGLAFAFITESLQLLVPTRHPLFTDVGIDLIGFAFGMIMYRIFLFKK